MSIDPTRASKWDPVYEGPYTILRQHRDGSYALQDELGQELTRRRTIEMLKVVDKEGPDKRPPTNKSPSYEVEKILSHRSDGAKGYQYLVKWKGYPNSQNSWTKGSDFNSQQPIKDYWKQQTANNKKKKTKKNQPPMPLNTKKRPPQTSLISSTSGLGGSDVRLSSPVSRHLSVPGQLTGVRANTAPEPGVKQLAWKGRLQGHQPRQPIPPTPKSRVGGVE